MIYMILTQELFSLYAKYKPTETNHTGQKISQTSRFGLARLHLLWVIFILVFFYPVCEAAATFYCVGNSETEMFWGNSANNIIDSNIINNDNNNIIDGNFGYSQSQSEFVKISLFDQLSVRGIDFEFSRFDSGLLPYSLTSLRSETALPKWKFCTAPNYRYENYNHNPHPVVPLPSATLRGKLQQRRNYIKNIFNRHLPAFSSDISNFNNHDSLGNLFVALGGAAVLANTSLDKDFRNWFQRNIKQPNMTNNGLNDFNAFAKEFGELPIIFGFALSAAGYKFFPYICPRYGNHQSVIGKYATMVSRGYLVGAPANLLGQFFIGAGRPNNNSSFWLKGKYNGVSGHAFVGAVPFITAAQMTDNLWLKFIFYTCSTFTAASRIYEDSHYLSQVLLGWYIAYLAVRAISKTEGKKLSRGLTIFPIIEKEKAGVGVIIKY
jgi:hypothetical protein